MRLAGALWGVRALPAPRRRGGTREGLEPARTSSRVFTQVGDVYRPSVWYSGECGEADPSRPGRNRRFL